MSIGSIENAKQRKAEKSLQDLIQQHVIGGTITDVGVDLDKDGNQHLFIIVNETHALLVKGRTNQDGKEQIASCVVEASALCTCGRAHEKK